MVDTCASGLSYSNLSSSTPNFDVYKFDQGCLVKLQSFDFGGVTYTPKSGEGFGSYADGDIATFEGSGTELKVTVVNQLDATISGTETVTYGFSEIVAGADEALANSVVADSQTLSVSRTRSTASCYLWCDDDWYVRFW